VVEFPKRLDFCFDHTFQGWHATAWPPGRCKSLTFGEIRPRGAKIKTRFLKLQWLDFPQSQTFAQTVPSMDRTCLTFFGVLPRRGKMKFWFFKLLWSNFPTSQIFAVAIQSSGNGPQQKFDCSGNSTTTCENQMQHLSARTQPNIDKHGRISQKNKFLLRPRLPRVANHIMASSPQQKFNFRGNSATTRNKHCLPRSVKSTFFYEVSFGSITFGRSI